MLHLSHVPDFVQIITFLCNEGVLFLDCR